MASGGTNDEGWNVIGRGKGKGRGRPQTFLHGLNPPLREYTAEKLGEEIQKKMKAWQRSSCRRELLQILDKQRPEQGWQISQAVCLATGSFSRENWQSRQRSVTQYAAFVDITQHLRSGHEAEIRCYAQEPQFTSVDKEYLRRTDVIVLEQDSATGSPPGLGPASQHLGLGTFVFEPFMDLDDKAMREMFSADLSLYIGSSVRRWMGRASRNGSTNVSVQQSSELEHAVDFQPHPAAAFVRARASYHFPVFEEEPNIFEGLAIYWKEPEDDEGG
ncbi:hypothetical protein B0A50_06211 [Salinomyces thailandicus]|uniref:SRR1-like domain-containing protein n=1 Tax=Salinomyces thailandicus TaxID=706561 RepID=A0A4U0TT43_9PEZI|nr:hypothetical protein B0A50_06211 [Salinomyces thailandica]